jgi:hypothetical protein
MWRWAARLCLCLALALVFVPCGVAWAEEAEPAEPAEEQSPTVSTVTVSVSFVGLDKEEWDRVDDLALPLGATAWDATTAALVQSHLYYTTDLPSSRQALVSLMRNLEDEPLEFDPSTGSGWRLYVNGNRQRGRASELELADGDEVSWRYEVGTFVVTVSVVGPGGTGQSYWIEPTPVRISYGQNAWDASLKVLEKNGYKKGRLLSYSLDDDGHVTLQSLAALGENGITGESWRAFLNGSPEEDIAHVALQDGDSICWYYAGNGEQSLPVFVVTSGAASQSPASQVRIDGTVVPVWSKPVARDDGTLAWLGNESGLKLSGASGLAEILTSDVILPHNLPDIASRGIWQKSLARVLDDVAYLGEGGLASTSRDGGICYLDGDGEVVKLGVL